MKVNKSIVICSIQMCNIQKNVHFTLIPLTFGDVMITAQYQHFCNPSEEADLRNRNLEGPNY